MVSQRAGRGAVGVGGRGCEPSPMRVQRPPSRSLLGGRHSAGCRRRRKNPPSFFPLAQSLPAYSLLSLVPARPPVFPQDLAHRAFPDLPAADLTRFSFPGPPTFTPSVVLNEGQFCPPGNIRRSLEALLVVTSRGGVLPASRKWRTVLDVPQHMRQPPSRPAIQP